MATRKNRTAYMNQWAKDNPEKKRFNQYKSNARTFVRKYASRGDKLELLKFIEQNLADYNN